MTIDALSEAVDRADLPALLAEFLPDSNAKAGRAGDVLCVWRGEINASGRLHCNEKGVWLLTDHGMGETYNAMRFLTDIMEVPKSEAAKELKKRYGNVSGQEVHSSAQRGVHDHPRGKGSTMDAFRLKQAELNRNGLPKTLEKRGLSLELVQKLGIGREGETAWIPILDPSGATQAIKRRYEDGKERRYDYTTTGNHSPCWHSPNWFNGVSVLIVEGELNAIACWAALGAEGSTVSVMGVAGASNTPNWEAVNGRRVFLLADDDDAGHKAVQKWRTTATGKGFNALTLSPLPDGLDACEYAEKHSIDGLRAVLAPSLYAEIDQPKWSKNSRPLTDMGNAERFVDLHANKVVYVYPFKSWLIWDGTRWTHDKNGITLRLAKETVRSIHHECAEEVDEKRRQELQKHATQSEKGGRLREILALAESEINIPPEKLDDQKMLFNVLNGTIDLSTGRLRPHDRRDMLTQQAPIHYDENALCPTWEAFLLRIMDERTHLVDFLRRTVGYTLTGLTDEQCLFLLYGTGANGKTTFSETLMALMGDYGTQSSFEAFEAKDSSNSGASPELARLKGARLVTATEIESGKRLNEAKVKQMTGGDTIAARHLFQNYFEFKGEFKLFLGANHKPEVRNNDEGIWRRIKLIPFEAYIPPKDRDGKLLDKLKAEMSGILAWAVRGCLEWQEHGLQVPSEVDAATQGYREDMDKLGAFLEDCCVLGRTHRATARDLYANYEKWCEQNGEKPITQRTFGLRLAERNLKQSRGTAGIRVWDGIGLISTGRGGVLD